MEWSKFGSKSALLLVLLCGAIASEPAWAQRGGHGGGRSRAHVGIAIGAPLFWPYYPQPYYAPYPYPYAYPYPPLMAVPSAPPLYIEQEPLPPQQYWYFCRKPQGYHPYVKNCPSGWLQVVPAAPGN